MIAGSSYRLVSLVPRVFRARAQEPPAGLSRLVALRSGLLGLPPACVARTRVSPPPSVSALPACWLLQWVSSARLGRSVVVVGSKFS
jgi:hypothetical protein